MARIIRFFKRAYEKYLKSHCPDCDGAMDSVMLDMEINKMVYECRECKKRWI